MWDNFIYYGKINQNRDSHKCTDGAFYKEIIVYLAVCRGTDCSGKRTKRKEYVFVQENWQQVYLWGIERSGFFNGREKWAKGFENQRV